MFEETTKPLVLLSEKLPLVLLSSWHPLKCTFSMPFMPSACFYNFTWKTKGKKRGNITYTMEVYRPK